MLSRVTEFTPDQLGAIGNLIEGATEPGVMYPPRGETWGPDYGAEDPFAGQIMGGEMARMKADWLEARDSWRWFEANPGPDVVLPPPDEWAAIRARMPELSNEEWAAIRARRKKKDEAEAEAEADEKKGETMRDERVVDLDAAREDAQRAQRANAFEPLKMRREWSQPPPARKWLVDGSLPDGRIALFTGRGGTGKSQLALQLATALSGDLPEDGRREWFEGGPEVQGGQGTTVFCTWEDDDTEILHRQLNNPAFASAGAPAFEEAMGGRFVFVDAAGRGPLWSVGPSRETFGELSPMGVALRAACEASAARLLVVDALASAYGCSENERPSVRAFLSSWDRWARDVDCTVLVVAHPPKNTDGADAVYSGSTDWRNGVRSMITLDRPKGISDRAVLKCDKLNSAATPNPVALASPRWWQAIEVDPAEIDDANTLEIRESIISTIREHGPLNRAQIRATLHKGKTAVDNTLEKMGLDGSLEMSRDGNAKVYRLANPDADLNPENDIPF